VPESIQEYLSIGFNLLLPTMRGVSKDEKCWSLFERDEFTPDYKQIKRVQTVRVHRNARLVEFKLDLGLASAFDAGPFVIPCLDEETVGWAYDQANWMRTRGVAGLIEAMDRHLEGDNVIQRAIERAEQTQEYLRRNPMTSSRLVK
jgi:hypothetical protein